MLLQRRRNSTVDWRGDFAGREGAVSAPGISFFRRGRKFAGMLLRVAVLRTRAPARRTAAREELGRAFGGSIPAGSASLQPPFARRILDALRRLAGDRAAVASPVLLFSTPARYHLKRLLEPFLPRVVVLSPLEVPPVIEVQSLVVLH
jgi:hypothetical protein